MGKKIYLSPSNQKANLYKYGNTNEMVQCNRIADFAKAALERCGFTVKKAPQGQAMNTSIAESNEWGSDLHIPIHTNAYNGNITGGTLVMLYENNAENNKAGKAILDAVAKISPGKDYALNYNTALAELRSTKMLSVYLEAEFHDTEEGAKWIIDNAPNIGEAIAKGVCDYYGVEYVSEKKDDTMFQSFAEALFAALESSGLMLVKRDTVAKPEPVKQIEKGSTVRVKQGAKTYDGGGLADFVYNRNHTVYSISGNRVVIDYSGIIVAAVHKDDLTLI